MTQVGGYLAHTGAGLQHVGGVAVPKCVDADFFVMFHEAALDPRNPHGGLHAGRLHADWAFPEDLL